MYVIEGLAGGAVAEVTKIHHACIDGVSGAEILGVLLDITPDPPPVAAREPPWRPEREASQWSMLGRGLGGLLSRPRVGFRLARRTVPNLGAVASNFSFGLPSMRRPRELLSSPGTNAPRTPFNGMITPHRRFAFGSLPLADVKSVKNTSAGRSTTSSWRCARARCGGGSSTTTRCPTAPLLAMVPVSVRTDEQRGTFGNRVSAMIAELPTDEPDPVERFHRMHDAMLIAKEQHRAIPADMLQDAIGRFIVMKPGSAS